MRVLRPYQAERRWTKGQITMALAAQLADSGIRADIALNAAMDIISEMKVPLKWREQFGEKVSAAIDADINDPKTWIRK